MKKISPIIVCIVVAILSLRLFASGFKSLGDEISDSVITAKITAKYTRASDLNPLKLGVHTNQGVVSLKGYVKDREAYVHALMLAKNTKGVRRILTRDLHIKKVNTAFTDAYITARAEAAVLKAKVLDDESIPLVGINATTTNGVVTLSGEVKKPSSIPAIVKRVKAIHGVNQVISHMAIKKDKA